MTNQPKYDTSYSIELDIFEFISTGKKGAINKIIQFQPMEIENVYN